MIYLLEKVEPMLVPENIMFNQQKKKKTFQSLTFLSLKWSDLLYKRRSSKCQVLKLVHFIRLGFEHYHDSTKLLYWPTFKPIKMCYILATAAFFNDGRHFIYKCQVTEHLISNAPEIVVIWASIKNKAAVYSAILYRPLKDN